MIQRIQSIYLLIAIICSILLFYVPYCSVISENPTPNATGQSFLLESRGIYKIMPDHKVLQISSPAFNILNMLFIGVCGLSIFLFKNRKLQVRVSKIAMLLVVVFFSSINYEIFNMTDLSDSSGHIRFLSGWYLPFAQILFLVLGIRSIQKDDELVRSADRLR